MAKYKCVYFLLVFIHLTLEYVQSARILGICHVPNKSHYIIGSSLLYGLAAKGHQVTIVSPFPSKENFTNVREIHIDGLTDIAYANRKTWSSLYDSNMISFFGKYRKFSHSLANATLNSKEIKNLLNSGEKFNLIIFDLFENHAFFGFGEYFNAPTIVLSTGNSMFVNALAGNTAPYAFVPNKFTAYSDQMSFVQRICNIFFYLYIDLVKNLFILPEQKKLYETHFRSVAPFEDTVKNASLYLINSHVLLESPRPYLPNMISVAGLHIKRGKLPQDLQEYLNNAKEGVILFSLGSVLHPNNIPEIKKRIILNTFAKLPQNILWKFETKNTFTTPHNVKIINWVPQNDVLAHPNVKLFITHGGLLSCIESVHHGVPVLGIPFFGDQYGNIKILINSGYGAQLLFQDLTEETFLNAIQKLLNNKSYSDNIKSDSKIFKDQPEDPLSKATFWVEHILRHKGGKHLQSRSVDLSLLQYLLLDIVFLFAIIITCVIYLFILFIKNCKQKLVKTKEN